MKTLIIALISIFSTQASFAEPAYLGSIECVHSAKLAFVAGYHNAGVTLESITLLNRQIKGTDSYLVEFYTLRSSKTGKKDYSFMAILKRTDLEQVNTEHASHVCEIADLNYSLISAPVTQK